MSNCAWMEWCADTRPVSATHNETASSAVSRKRVIVPPEMGPRRNPTPAAAMRQIPQKRPLKTLERVLSKAGVGSRTEARSWVHEGRVKVNGKVTRDPDRWVDMERDRVSLDEKPLEARDRLYVLLYKPTGYL